MSVLEISDLSVRFALHQAEVSAVAGRTYLRPMPRVLMQRDAEMVLARALANRRRNRMSVAVMAMRSVVSAIAE